MPRKPKKAIGPWERLTPEALEPLPKNGRSWALRIQDESLNGPWAKPRDWGTWEDLPPEYRAALVWAYLYAGPSNWFEQERMEYLIKRRPVSILKIVTIENRNWMINAIKKIWPNLTDIYLQKGIAIFFQMNWESIKHEFIDHKNLLSVLPNFKNPNMEKILGQHWKEILNDGFLVSMPQPELGMAHYYNWLMSEAEETKANGFDLAGLVLPIHPFDFIQKRLIPTAKGISAGFLRLSSDHKTYHQISNLLKELKFSCKTLIGTIPDSLAANDGYCIGGSLQPLKDLPTLAHHAIRAIMHHNVKHVPSLDLIGKTLTIEQYRKLYPDDCK